MIRFGVIGAGNIANVFCHAVNNSNLDARLEGIASRSLEKARKYQEQYNFTKAYGNYKEMYEEDSIDVIYIATPHGLHYEQMLEILDYKKHILCEKSFTLNAIQAEAVFKKAKANNVFIMEAVWTRFLPVIRQLQEEINNGIIGEVKEISADFCIHADQPDEGRLFNPKLGGGALLDLGIYPITFANLFMGKPDSITSTVEKHHTGVDVSEKIIYTYGQKKAYITASLKEEKPIKAVIKGTKGSVLVKNFFFTENATIYDNEHNVLKEINIPHETNGFEYEIREVVSCIKNTQRESKIMPHDETVEILKQMDYLRKSWNFSYPQET